MVSFGLRGAPGPRCDLAAGQRWPSFFDAFSANRRAVVAPELAAIRAALKAAGVEFIHENGGEPGVKLKKARDRRAAGKVIGTALQEATLVKEGWSVAKQAW